MKIAFSTLGCPEWSWQDIYTMAKDIGFDGIEVRGLGDETIAMKAGPFTDSQLDKTMAKLNSIGLEIPCFSSGCCLKLSDKLDSTKAELIQYMSLCKRTGTPYLRVLADLEPHCCGEVEDDAIAAVLKELVPVAKENNVTLLIETNGVYADTARLRTLLDSVASDNVAALWDLHHPYRFMNEAPKVTAANLGSYIKYVHIKDSMIVDGAVKYRMLGEGDMPIADMIDALKDIGYDGYISLEWVKRWSLDLEDAAIVFPHFVSVISRYIDTAPKAVKPAKADGFIERGKGEKIWEKDVLVDLTFGELLCKVANDFPNQYAFKYTTLDYTRTYSEFKEDADRFARALLAMGVKKGDHVAIWATNVPQWFITFWAVTRIGAILVTVNTAYKIHEAEYLLKQSDTHTLVMIDGYKDSNYVEIIKQLCPELEFSKPGELHSEKLPVLRNVITVDSTVAGCYTWEQAMDLNKNVPQSEVEAIAKTLHKDDVCNMQYTSGTTGFPKGVMLTHYNVINNGKCIGDCMNLSTADRMLIQVPMFHCFGMVLSMVACITHGSTMSPLEYFQPKKALAAINNERITAINGVPTMFIALLENEDFDKTDFSHMRTGIMAGSPCPVKVMQDVVDRMNISEITIVFGQTESSPGCTQSRANDPLEVRVGTVGSPLPGVECKIVDPVTGEDLPDETDGEFVARGYNIMRGYYKMPEATAAAIDPDGWLHTGDLARRTPNGNFKITGRMKDMIIRGGENIYPKEIEEFLYTHPEVKDVQVIGVPDVQYGEAIMACVIRKDSSTITEEEIKDFVRTHMAKHKTPKYVSFVNEFPMNAAGKILKYKMRETAVEQLNLKDASNITTA